MNEKEKNNEITIGFLFTVLRYRLIWLIAALLVGAVLAFGYTKLFVTPIYSSRTEFCVENSYESPSMMNSGYQQGAAQLAASYAHEVTGNVFLEEIAAAYNEQYGRTLSVSALSSKISVSTESELPIFRVKVSSPNAQEAYDILQVIQQKTPEMLLNESTKSYVNVKMTSYGHLATSPESPNTVMNVAVGAMFGFLLAYVVCFLIAFLDKTVYDEETLKNNCTVPVVGQIPQWLKKDAGGKQEHTSAIETKGGKAKHINRDYSDRLLAKDTPFSISEAFKTLRTNLTYVAVEDDRSPVFGITSAFAGAGKSLVIANVAISFAHLGKKVLLIDGDMRCPTQHKVFGLSEAKHGLAEALAGLEKRPFESCVLKKKEYETLDIMPCGHVPPNPAELLASERMGKLLEEAKEKYDYIFIDLPPILETADAGVVAPVVSAYVVVARAGYSKIDAVADAISTMQSMHANVAGCVLNDVNTKSGFGYYSHYSRYGRYGRYARYNRMAQQNKTDNA